jgi:heat shock protein HslJ
MLKRYSLLGVVLMMTVAMVAACTPTGGAPAGDIAEPTAETEEGSEMTEIKTLFVGPDLVDCVGVGPQTCMQVKEDRNEEYRLFYDQIEGFTFEPGNEHELRVSVETVANPPADGSSLRYSLIEVVSQTPVAGALEGAAMEKTELEETRWGLISYQNADGDTVEALPDHEVTLEFEDGRVAGNGGCNNFFGTYTVDGNQLTISALGSTMMACLPEEVMQQEAQVLALLSTAATYEIVDGQLLILDPNGETILAYEPIIAADLTGVTWAALNVNNGRQAVSSLVADSSITAVFGEDGSLTGSAGCNNYMTAYTLDGENITIQPPASTRMMCPDEGVMDQESAYLMMLPQAATYSIQGDQLELRTADGALIALYQPEAAE